MFAALLELRPGDGEAHNNYGFCLLPSDPAAAQAAFQRALLFDWTPTPVNTANQVLALHLSGRHDEAVALGRSLLDSGQAHGEQGFAWDHTGPDEPINLVKHGRWRVRWDARAAHARRLLRRCRHLTPLPRDAGCLGSDQ